MGLLHEPNTSASIRCVMLSLQNDPRSYVRIPRSHGGLDRLAP
jgi:hypothetical protein